MGKYAQYLKRGKAAQQGYLAPPGTADWSLGTPLTTSVPATRSAAIPAGADGWATRALLASTGATAATNAPTGSTSNNISGLVTGTSYLAQAAWFLGLRQVSDWSVSKPFTTA